MWIKCRLNNSIYEGGEGLTVSVNLSRNFKETVRTLRPNEISLRAPDNQVGCTHRSHRNTQVISQSSVRPMSNKPCEFYFSWGYIM